MHSELSRIEIHSLVSDSRVDAGQKKISSALTLLSVADVYTLTKALTDSQKELAGATLIHPVIESAFWMPKPDLEADFLLETSFLPGVTDNLGSTVRETLEDALKTPFSEEERVYSSTLYAFKGSRELVETLGKDWTNALIQSYRVMSLEEYRSEAWLKKPAKVSLQHAAKSDRVNVQLDDEALKNLGKYGIQNEDGSYRGPLALSLRYMKTIQEYFAKEGRDPSDVELEAIAQTWSEHCKHTIFADPIDDVEQGIFKYFIRRATEDIRKAKGDKDFCVSVFKDNSGAIAFDENYLVTDKAETHNSPSALDPFGGAITGIVGVNRDSLGFGLGAKPVANRYGFCFAPFDQSPELYRSRDKKNPILPPKKIMEGVIAGVNAGGNESGIPTPQGFMYFDESYVGKPLVFVGTIGLIPRTLAGKLSHEKQAQVGDKIVVAGGRVGLDGIHGATFSSEALDSESPATAVQIGDPIIQKKLSDVVVREAREMGLYNSITDNGAGGISCSIAEMAKESGGCFVELEKVPLKYPNLSPWEIWISESQERMTFAVPPEKVETLLNLFASRGVEASVVGEFTNSGRCTVQYHGEVVMDLEMDFLHEGLPAIPQKTAPYPYKAVKAFEGVADVKGAALALLASKNIGSTAFVNRQFDHEVQGGSVVKPLQGKNKVSGPAAAFKPILNNPRGVVLSQSLSPRLSEYDAYLMAAVAIDDAIAKAVSLGANVDHMAIMDNYCWCSSTDPQRLAQLKESAQACYDYAVAYGTPYISGKDSMFNDFKGFNANNEEVLVSALPTLLISAMSVVENVTKLSSISFKKAGDKVYQIGETKEAMACSELNKILGLEGGSLPEAPQAEKMLDRYRRMYQAHQSDLLKSAIHLEAGGLWVALAKGAMANEKGLRFESEADAVSLFSESRSRFLVSISPARESEFLALFPEAEFLGEVQDEPVLHWRNLRVEVSEMLQAYQSPFTPFS